MDNHCCLDYEEGVCSESCEYAKETNRHKELEADGKIESSFWNHWGNSSRCKKHPNDG